jgi:hypothetical protein
MTDDDKIAQLERRIIELEGYLSQFESFRNFRKRDTKNNTAAIATTHKPDKTKRGTRLCEDWQPDETLVHWATHDFPHVDLQLEVAKFVDYWIARADRGAYKLSWDRTFRNWIRTASSSYRRKRETHQRPDKLDFNQAVRTSFD